MTVEELIERLKTYPKDAIVGVRINGDTANPGHLPPALSMGYDGYVQMVTIFPNWGAKP